MASSSVTVEHTHRDGVDVLMLRGELDLTNAETLDGELERATAAAVVLDLGGLSFIDSAGMRVIDRGNRRLAEEGRTLVIVASGDSAAGWLLRIAGVSDSAVTDSLESAVRYASRVDGRNEPAPASDGRDPGQTSLDDERPAPGPA
jgi:anti-anti-sigma factor